MMKKIIVCIAVLAVVLLLPNVFRLSAHATTTSESEELILDEVQTRLDEIDLSKIEEYYEESVSLSSNSSESLREIIGGIIRGDITLGFEEIIDIIIDSVDIEISSVLKLVCLIVIIAGFGAFSDMLNIAKDKKGVSGVVSFIMVSAVLSVVTTIFTDFISETITLLNNMRGLSEALFPLLISLVVMLGGANTSTAIEPAIVFLTSGVTTIISSLTTFSTVSYFVLSVIGELTDSIKLDQLKALISSIFKWGVGLVFTIYMGYMSINGIIGVSRDGLTIKTAKYALKNYIPMVGGYLSDSYELFRVGSELIKNSIGVVGVVLLFGMVIKKVLTLGVYKLGFMLASGITEPFGTKKITRFLSSLSVLFNFLIAGVLVSFLMIIITIFIVMSLVGV